jgi:hypothetical protein
MPACCGVPDVQPASVSPLAAAWLLWLAVNTHVGCGCIATGSAESISAMVHAVRRAAFPVRTRATSAAVMNEPVLPNAFRT